MKRQCLSLGLALIVGLAAIVMADSVTLRQDGLQDRTVTLPPAVPIVVTPPTPVPDPVPVPTPDPVPNPDPSPAPGPRSNPPAGAPSFASGDISKMPAAAILTGTDYTVSGDVGVGHVLYAQNVGAVVQLKSGQQVWLLDSAKVYGVTFRGGSKAGNVGNHQAAVMVANDCYLEDVTVEKSAGPGICFDGDDSTSLRLVAQDNAASGRGANSAHRYHSIDGKILRNNFIAKDHNGGGGKLLKGYDIVLDGDQVFGNLGTGVWFDWDAQGVVVRNCTFGGQIHWDKSGASFDVYGTGRDLYIEGNIKGPGLIEGNTFLGSEGARIEVAESARMTIRGNTFGALAATSPSTRRLAAIAFRDIDRKNLNGVMQGNMLQNITVGANTFKDGTQIIRGDGGGGVTKSKNNITVGPDNVWVTANGDKIPN